MKNFIEQRKEMIERFGPEVKDRRTGRTTSDCFNIISTAMRNINLPIKIYDHYSNDRMMLSFNTIPRLWEIIKKMGLEGFTINKQDMTITYSLD